MSVQGAAQFAIGLLDELANHRDSPEHAASAMAQLIDDRDIDVTIQGVESVLSGMEMTIKTLMNQVSDLGNSEASRDRMAFAATVLGRLVQKNRTVIEEIKAIRRVPM